MTPDEEEEILAVLSAVSAEDPATLVPVQTARGLLTTWSDIFAGDVAFRLRGWTIVVFNDCNSWDHLDRIEAPDGRTWDFDDMTDAVRDWQPQSDAGWSPGCVPAPRPFAYLTVDDIVMACRKLAGEIAERYRGRS